MHKRLKFFRCTTGPLMLRAGKQRQASCLQLLHLQLLVSATHQLDTLNEWTGIYCTTNQKTSQTQGRSDGGVYRYIYSPKISPWKLFCALIAADVVRLLVYKTVVSCSKNYTHPKWISGYAPGQTYKYENNVMEKADSHGASAPLIRGWPCTNSHSTDIFKGCS